MLFYAGMQLYTRPLGVIYGGILGFTRVQWRRQLKKRGGPNNVFLLVSSKKLQKTYMGTPIYKILFNGFYANLRRGLNKSEGSGPTHSPMVTPLLVYTHILMGLLTHRKCTFLLTTTALIMTMTRIINSLFLWFLTRSYRLAAPSNFFNTSIRAYLFFKLILVWFLYIFLFCTIHFKWRIIWWSIAVKPFQQSDDWDYIQFFEHSNNGYPYILWQIKNTTVVLVN